MESYPLYTHYVQITKDAVKRFESELDAVKTEDEYDEEKIIRMYDACRNYIRGARDMCQPYLVSTQRLDYNVDVYAKIMEADIEMMCVRINLYQPKRVSLYRAVGIEV